VVGMSQTKRGEAHAFLAFKNQMIDLNDLLPVVNLKEIRRGWFGTEPPLKRIVFANAINNDGSIVACGEVWNDARNHGFLLVPEASFEPTPGEARGFDPSILYEPGSYRYFDLGFLPGAGDCLPYCMNEFNDVIGVSSRQGFVWSGGQIDRLDYTTKQPMISCAINEVFAAAGWIFDDAGDPQATIWDWNLRTSFAVEPRIGWTSGKAFDVNDGLHVVGWAMRPGESSKATLWYRQGDGYVAVNLNDRSIVSIPSGPLKWITLEQATAIDESMRIAGTGAIADGSARGFLLTPVTTTVPIDEQFGPWSSGPKFKMKGQ
jgi:probable HAF family extracellular repeat protein